MNLEDDRLPRIMKFLRLNNSLNRDYTIKSDDIDILLHYICCLERRNEQLQLDLETPQYPPNDKAWA